MSLRLHPRRALIAAGLTAVALTIVRDRDLLALPRLKALLDGKFDVDSRDLAIPVERVRKALTAHQNGAESRFEAAFEPWWYRLGSHGATRPTDTALAAYWAIRADAHPAYAASLQQVATIALAARADEPDNGAFEVVAGLIDVELACSPGSVDPLLLYPTDLEHIAPLVRIDDPARLARGLALLDAGLARPRLAFPVQPVVAARVAGIDGTPLERLARRLGRAYCVNMPELQLLRDGIEFLTVLARRERVMGADGGPALLARARRLALRHGAEAANVIEVSEAQMALKAVDRAWLLDAAARGDVARVQGAAHEGTEVTRAREAARRLQGDLALDRLGIVDATCMPMGGWPPGEFDEDLSRRMDHAVLESLILLALLVVGLLGVPIAWLRARTTVPADAPRAAGWTLGDLLAVVLPSFGAVAVLALMHGRLHPARGLGFPSPQALYVAMAHGVVFVALAAFSFCWLLRRSVLGKHGLTFARPASARGGLWLVLVGAHGALLWVAGRDTALLVPSGALMLAGLVAAWRGGALGRPAPGAAGAAVRAYEARVGLAALGVSLALVAAIECVLVAPRRDGLVRSVEAQVLRLLDGEARLWGAGGPQAQLRELLEEAPDGPVVPPPR